MTRRTHLLLLALVAGLLCACRPGLATGGPRSWIDAPRHGSSLALGPVDVVCRASHPRGVAQVELWVNGMVVGSEASGEPVGAVLTARLHWRPSAPGTYVLQVRARSTAGAWGPFARADVTLTGQAPTTTRLPSRTPTPTWTATASPVPIPSPTATVPPTDTPPPTTIARSTPPPPTATPSPIVLPSPTTARAVAAGPAISGPDVSPAQFYYGGAGCGPQEATVTVQASDARGVAGVRIYFALADKASGKMTRWASAEMAQTERGWSATVVPARDIPGYDSFRQAWFQFYFVATNSQGGQTKSAGYWTGFTLSRCSGS